MKIDKRYENLVYTLMLITGAVVIYIVQHECVRIGFDAALSAYDYMKAMFS